MAGEKYTPLIIEKASKPRCFNKIKTEALPVQYKANKKAWMNSFLFEEWVKKLDRKMKSQNRHILLFIDNAPSHPHVTLTNVTLKFFPPNTTSKTQPMDQGIIQTVKLKFRKRQLKFVLNKMEKSEKNCSELLKEISVLNVIYWVHASWQEVETTTIQRCFARCGFDPVSWAEKSVAECELEFDNDADDSEDDVPLQVLKLSKELFGCDFKDLKDIDAELQSRDDNVINFDMPANELLETLRGQNVDDGDDDDDDDDDTDCVETHQKISVSQANESVQVLRQFALQTGNHEILDYVFKVEESLADVALSKTKQSSICDFFKRCDE